MASVSTSSMVPSERVTEELSAYLERRGFEANTGNRPRPLPLVEFVHQRAVDCERGTGQPVKLGAPLVAPCRLEEEFIDFKNFISEAVEPFRSELSHCLWPVFVNALIDLLSAEQRHLLQRFEGMFGGLFSGVDLYSGLVEDLQGISSPQELQQCSVLKEFRENKALVKLSADSWRYLQRFLRQSEYISHLFNVHIDVSIQLDLISQHRLWPEGLEPGPTEPSEPHLFQARHMLAQRHHQHLASQQGRAGKSHLRASNRQNDRQSGSGAGRHKSPSSKRSHINGMAPMSSTGPADATHSARTASNGASTISPEPPAAAALSLLRQSIDKVRAETCAPNILLIDIDASALSCSVASLALSEETLAIGLDNGTISLERRGPTEKDVDSDQEDDQTRGTVFSSCPRGSWKERRRGLHSSIVRLHPSATRTSSISSGRLSEAGEEAGTYIEHDRKRSRLLGHSGAVSALAYASPSLLLSASSDTSVRAWDAATGRNMAVYMGHQYPAWCLATSPEGLYFATGSQDATARLWTPSRTHALRVLAGHLGQVDTLAFHPNANYLATAASDRSIRLWAVQSGSVVRLFPSTHRGQAHSLAFSPNGHWLAAAGEDRAVRLWDLRTCRLLADMHGHHDAVTSIVFSKDGSLLLSASLDGCARMWDVHTLSSSSASSSSSAPGNAAASGNMETSPVNNGGLVCCLRFQPRISSTIQEIGSFHGGIRKLQLHHRLNVVTAVRVYGN
ncbi:TAF5-like RNA polymerase II p300/CBP-associated factor-associated factor subunit 5L [Tropilaelaps mercedesae]|uniref:TAF5-like RNA polymerase II p300/CBP-associated factor-associated factor subunit 5L n=1 Tax=Tropilaelaps mercedesae TaxID=418985 RepID=A0A1V9Y251_9ACAR|nr:TAF5-like RNA polymerase II p300/CBP-associated factor-associated factor subunit 5L [Tropilaelaps mercedesae]